MIPQPQPTHSITLDELAALLGDCGEHPADMRERLRAKLDALPDAARLIYNRDNIRAKNTPLITVVETILYYFDFDNRQRVAVQLGMLYSDMMTLLIGFMLGQGE